jgi:hypothetical protein
VNGPESLRYTVYEDGTLYLLNMDFDGTVLARVTDRNGVQEVLVEPQALVRVQVAL